MFFQSKVQLLGYGLISQTGSHTMDFSSGYWEITSFYLHWIKAKVTRNYRIISTKCSKWNYALENAVEVGRRACHILTSSSFWHLQQNRRIKAARIKAAGIRWFQVLLDHCNFFAQYKLICLWIAFELDAMYIISCSCMNNDESKQ